MLKQHKMDLSYIHQATDIGLEIRSEEELLPLLASLQDPNCDWVTLRDREHSITLHVYLLHREQQAT